MKPTAATLKGNYTMMGKLTKFIKTKAHFIFPVFKTEWQIRHSIIGERPPNWCARKLLIL